MHYYCGAYTVDSKRIFRVRDSTGNFPPDLCNSGRLEFWEHSLVKATDKVIELAKKYKCTEIEWQTAGVDFVKPVPGAILREWCSVCGADLDEQGRCPKGHATKSRASSERYKHADQFRRLGDMLEYQVYWEQQAIDGYRLHAKYAKDKGDLVTSELFNHIMLEEEHHKQELLERLREVVGLRKVVV